LDPHVSNSNAQITTQIHGWVRSDVPKVTGYLRNTAQMEKYACQWLAEQKKQR